VAARPLSAREIAALTGGELIGPPDLTVAGVASLEDAGPGQLSFLASGAYLPYFQSSRAGLVLVPPGFRDVAAGPAARVVVSDPRAAMRVLMEHMASPPALTWGIAPTARIGRGCRWSGRVAVGPGATLGGGVTLGADCRVGPQAAIGEGAQLGNECVIDAGGLVGPGAVLGDRVHLKAGARVGLEGFAFIATPDGPVRVPHLGGCRIGDDVEIGANATVDRGSVGLTSIGPGTKLDNLVHVGHNVRIGARCLIMAQTGIAGAVTVGDDVTIAGQAGLADHLRVGDGARIAAQSGVIGDVPAGAAVSGYPARDHRQVLRQAAALRRLTPLVAALERLARTHDEQPR
jgi:UDP-3-O-[3-hydroxymyristoyl] glucosamine N-acyltransferase